MDFSSMRVRLILYVTAITLLMGTVASCGKKQVPPEEVYRQFHTSLLRAGRGDPAAFQTASRHLSQKTIEALTERAETVNASLPPNAPKVDPRQMLSISGLETDAMPSDIEVELKTHDEVELKVTLDGHVHTVRMVREKQQWKIDLSIASTTSNRTNNPLTNR